MQETIQKNFFKNALKLLKFKFDIMKGKSTTKNSAENKSEKILLISAFLMFAALIGYNAFFTPSVNLNANVQSDVDEFLPNEATIENDENDEVEIVNINTASTDVLTKNLNGVGPAIAQRIIDYREKFGGFSSIEEIKNVKGIGEKIFLKIKDNISVS